MPPGWYDDPWSPAALRWWDGTQWTPHVSGRVMSMGPAAYLAPDLAGAERWARRASVAAIAYAVTACGGLLFTAVIFHRLIHNLVHQLDQINNQLATDPNAQLSFKPVIPAGQLVGMYGISALGVAAQIVFIVWFVKAAENGERLGLPHRRAPLWAVLGFFVPVVNFWFPYQVAADLFPPDDPDRSVAGWWWGCYLAQGVMTILVVVVSIVSSGAALLTAVVCCAVPVAAAVKQRRLIAAATERHRALATR